MIPRDAVREMEKLAASERQHVADYEAMAERMPLSRERFLARAKKCREQAEFYEDWAASAREDERARAA